MPRFFRTGEFREPKAGEWHEDSGGHFNSHGPSKAGEDWTVPRWILREEGDIPADARRDISIRNFQEGIRAGMEIASENPAFRASVKRLVEAIRKRKGTPTLYYDDGDDDRKIFNALEEVERRLKG